MPHKKNPINTERICGMARLLRGYALTAMENVALWHERDISHSSAERVLFPDAFHLAHYMLERLRKIVAEMRVYPERMRYNLELTRGLLFSQNALAVLLHQGLDRQAAYRLIQRNAMRVWENQAQDLMSALAEDAEVVAVLGDVRAAMAPAFDLKHYTKHIDALFARAGIEG
jgi:adenylosuccinate lyase